MRQLIRPSCFLRLFLLLHTAKWFLCAAQKRLSTNECEKAAHVSFTASQKKELCEYSTSVGPAHCANLAKNELRLKFEDILALCIGALSSAPAKCYQAVPVGSARSKHGIALCKSAASPLSAQCYVELSKYSGTLKIKDEKLIVGFCAALDDRAPLDCIAEAVTVLQLSPTLTIETCKHAVATDSSLSNCLKDMKRFISSSRGLTATEVVVFCAEAQPSLYGQSWPQLSTETVKISGTSTVFSSPSAACYALVSENAANMNSGATQLAPRERLQLCANAPNTGPANCSYEISSRTDVRLKPDAIISLCSGAVSAAPAQCLIETRTQIGGTDVQTKIELCAASISTGPARCFNRAHSIFRRDDSHLYSSFLPERARGPARQEYLKVLLCVGAESEDPFQCASAASPQLNAMEKIHLCAHAPWGRGLEPVTCLRAAEERARQLSGGSKYYTTTAATSTSTTATTNAAAAGTSGFSGGTVLSGRSLLLAMCSFGSSQNPLASAECLKSTPIQTNHDDAVRMCTNVSSAEVINHITLCTRLLPRHWSRDDINSLCESGTSRLQIEAAVRCAVTVSQPPLRANPESAAKLCRTERAEASVLECIQSATKKSSSFSSSNTLLSLSVITRVCTDTPRKVSGECLASLVSYPFSNIAFDEIAVIRLCTSTSPLAQFDCLQSQRSSSISLVEVEKCVATPREPTSVRLISCISEDGHPALVAGKRFSLQVQLLDQYGSPLLWSPPSSSSSLSSSSSSSVDGSSSGLVPPVPPLTVAIAINENNEQGAVLWGLRSNTTTNDRFLLSSLVISQPGSVTMKLYWQRDQYSQYLNNNNNNNNNVNTNNNHRINSNAANKKKDSSPTATATTTLGAFILNVQEDPRMQQSAPCLVVFSTSTCPIATSTREEDDWLADFPYIRGSLPPQLFLQTLQCQDTLQLWAVDAYWLPSGVTWVKYRQGVDAIWTGVGLPRVEMSFEERLGLTTDTPSNNKGRSSANKANLSGGGGDDDYGNQIIISGDGEDDSSITGAAAANKEGGGGTKSGGEYSNQRRGGGRGRKGDDSSSSISGDAQAREKAIRRAYYRLSLQWHPDRWAAMPIYSTAVQGIFQLISEAYEALSAKTVKSSTNSTNENNSRGSDATTASDDNSHPIYM